MSNQWYDIDTWQWVDNNEAQWGFSVGPTIIGGLYQVFIDYPYVYAATSSGLDIISIENEQRITFIENTQGYRSVCSDGLLIYLASSAGVKSFYKSEISEGAELNTSLFDFARAPLLTSDDVTYIHGNDTKLICCTSVGVDIVRKGSGYITNTVVSGTALKCFVTPNHDYFYYLVSGTNNYSIQRLNNNTSNWITPDLVYTTGSGVFVDTIEIKDFFVTENTAISGINNTLFTVCDDGAYVIDESTLQNLKYTTNDLLAGTSLNYNSVWADLNTNIVSGKFYVSTTGSGAAFSVIDLGTESILDNYSLINSGNNNEFLVDNDIVDISVTGT